MFYNVSPPSGSVVRACMVGTEYEPSSHHRYRSDLTAVIETEHPVVELDHDGNPTGVTTVKGFPAGATSIGVVVYVDRGNPKQDVLLEFQTVELFHGLGGDLLIQWHIRKNTVRPVLWLDDNGAAHG